MSSVNDLAPSTGGSRSLRSYVNARHQAILDNPARFLRPLLDSLGKIHAAGYAHGAVLPACVRVKSCGSIDVDYFETRGGSDEPDEAATYYPLGRGESPDESRRRDLQALGAVLHLIVADHPPASPGRRGQKLADSPPANEWPAAFIGALDRLLDFSPDVELPTLVEISAALEPPAPVPAVSPPAPPPPSMRLPNAMVGREFSASLDEFLGQPTALSELPAGLEIQDGILAGTPETAGEFEIVLRWQADASTDRTAAITINPDPRSLWKNLTSDESADFWKPDTATASLSDGPLFVIGASTRGRSHAHVGSFRDDDLAMATFPGPWHSLTVADGAGSAKFSRRGSQIVCREMTDHFDRYFADADNALTRLAGEEPDSGPLRTELYKQFGGAAIAARKAIEEQAAASSATLRDFHTTLITTLLHPLADGRWFVAAFSIGDGAAALIGAPGDEPCLLTRPDGGEYAGQTVFLTMKEALADADGIMARISVAVVADFQALVLATDGITDPRFDSETAIADPQVWTALWQEIQAEIAPADSRETAAAALLAWMNFHSPGHHDDRTLVLAAPHFTPARL